MDEVLEEGLSRLQNKPTWKLWHWPLDGEEFYDADSFRWVLLPVMHDTRLPADTVSHSLVPYTTCIAGPHSDLSCFNSLVLEALEFRVYSTADGNTEYIGCVSDLMCWF